MVGLSHHGYPLTSRSMPLSVLLTPKLHPANVVGRNFHQKGECPPDRNRPALGLRRGLRCEPSEPGAGRGEAPRRPGVDAAGAEAATRSKMRRRNGCVGETLEAFFPFFSPPSSRVSHFGLAPKVSRAFQWKPVVNRNSRRWLETLEPGLRAMFPFWLTSQSKSTVSTETSNLINLQRRNPVTPG